MPWRLICFILIFAVFLVFIAFNLDNNCNINLIAKEFTAVPIYLTALTSFVIGMLCAIPFIISVRKKKDGDKPAASGKKGFFGFGKAAAEPESSGGAFPNPENTVHGE